MIGYQEESGSRVYRLYDDSTTQVLITQDVVFDETTTRATTKILLPENEEGGFKQAGKIQGSSTAKLRDRKEVQRGSEEEDHGIGQPLPPIDPDEQDIDTSTYDHDTIVV